MNKHSNKIGVANILTPKPAHANVITNDKHVCTIHVYTRMTNATHVML